MNILFILGNGFDINLGLHTGYQDFYDYYLKQPCDNEEIAKLKKHLENERYSTWADLELGLGKYTTEVDSVEQLRIVYYDLDDRLREFLKKEDDSFESNDNILKAISSAFISPQSVLPLGMRNAINAFCNGHNPFLIDVISFNYTNTLEKIFQPVKGKGSHIFLEPQISLRSINHVHMRLEDEDVIMGVNDESQIHNSALINDELRSLLIKPYINQQLQNLIDSECNRLIGEADLICIYGTSIGETDMIWWQSIGKRFQNANIRIILYVYENNNITRNSERIVKYSASKKLLFDRMGISNPTEEQLSKVYVGYRTSLFHIR